VCVCVLPPFSAAAASLCTESVLVRVVHDRRGSSREDTRDEERAPQSVPVFAAVEEILCAQ
jgi:hypothetical protein